MEIPDIERTFKGTVICLAGGVPLYAAGLFPGKFKAIPYTAGIGLEALGLYEIYQGIWGKKGGGGSNPNVPATQIKDKLINFNFEYPKWGSQIIPNRMSATEFNLSWQTTPEINDLIGNHNDIGAYIWGRLFTSNEKGISSYRLWSGKFLGIWEEVSRIALYNSPNIPKFFWKVYAGANSFWGKTRGQMDVCITDALIEPKAEWWEHFEDPLFKKHLIGSATTTFTIK